MLEARGGIEPPDKGFADLCLTTWLPRQLVSHTGLGGRYEDIPFRNIAQNGGALLGWRSSRCEQQSPYQLSRPFS
jgi:hypothetical protein